MNLQRRDFLKTTGLLSAAALCNGLRADEAAPTAPRDLVRVAVVGVRGRGCDLIKPWAAMKDVQIAAICDVDTNVTAKALKICTDAGQEKPRFEQDFRRLLDDKSIDAVAISTSNHWHALATVLALQAGKHVYVEKPVSQTLFEGRRMVEAARKYNRVCFIGTQRRSSEAMAKAVEFLRAGKLGKVNVGRGVVYKRRESIGKKVDAPVPAGVDYNLWQGPAPERAFNPNRFHYEWHWNWDYGSGEMGNNGIHMLDVVRWGMNKNELPKKVISIGGRYGYDDDGQTPNTQIACFDYGDSQMICETRGLPTDPYPPFVPPPADAATRKNHPNSLVVFHCSEGILTLLDKPIAYNLKGEIIETFTGTENHYRKFIDSVRAGKIVDPNCDIQEGHLSTGLCHLANISYRLGKEQAFDGAEMPFSGNDVGNETFKRMSEHLKTNNLDMKSLKYSLGRTLTIDPKTETFVSDAEASAMLTREYRKPFVVPEKV